MKSGGLEVVELRGNSLDPIEVEGEILETLGLSYGTIEASNVSGGCNEGVWFLRNAGHDLVLKLITCERLAPTVLSECEQFQLLSRMHPGIMSDQYMSFPIALFRLHCSGVEKDLVVMRKVTGECLGTVIGKKWYGGHIPQLLEILEKLGKFLRSFHNKYGNAQHTDFQPSNVFYDEARNEFFLIDLGGMGTLTTNDDVQHFCNSLKILSNAYGAQLEEDGVRRFRHGYNQATTRPTSHADLQSASVVDVHNSDM